MIDNLSVPSKIQIFFFLFSTGIRVPMACAQQGIGVAHPAQKPNRHQNLSLFVLLHCFVLVVFAPAPGVFCFNSPPLLIQTILICLCLRRCLPCPRQVKPRLFPPPHPYPCPPLPLHCLAQVHNWSSCNILRDRILPSPNDIFHRLKPRLLSRRLRQGVLLPSVRPPLWKPSRQSLCHLVLETPQDLSSARLTTHVSAPNINTDWMTDLKKNPDTRSLARSLLMILDVLLQTARALVRFWITSGQSSSADNITLPSYFKYRTISRVRPQLMVQTFSFLR